MFRCNLATTCTFDRDFLRAIEKHGRGMGIHHGEQELFTMSKIYHIYPNQQYPIFFLNFGTTKTMFSQESFLSVQ